MISASAFRAVRRKTLKAIACPCGFEEHRNRYLRRSRSGQVHCIEFLAMKYGHGFTVDLGFHYASAPHFVSPTAEHHPDELTAEGCCFQKRLRKPDGDQFYGYGETAEEAAVLVTTIASEAFAEFATLENTWSDGRKLLAELPPEVLAKDAQTFEKVLSAPTIDEQKRISGEMHIRQLFPGWFPHIVPVSVLLGYLCIEHGQLQALPKYVELAKRTSWSFGDTRIDAIIKKLARLAKKRDKSRS